MNKKRKFKIEFYMEANGETWDEAQAKVEEKVKGNVKITRVYKPRTETQNAALHLWFQELADELNNAGMYLQKVLKVDMPWDAHTIKNYLWRPVQKQLLNTESTRDLKTDEVDKVYVVVDKAIGERTGVHMPFPSLESLIDEDLKI